jgi:Flp pilus assembly protein TadD
MAVLRFENLGPDPSADWMGRAFCEVLTSELSDAPNLILIPASRLHAYAAAFGARPASAPGISTERPAALAAGASRLVYGDYTAHPGRVDVHVTVEDPASRQMTRVLSVSAADVYRAATALALQISPSIRPYATRNTATLRAYATALESDGAEAIPQLEQAIAADANFGPAYELLAQLKAQHQDLAGAEAVLQSALSRGDSIRAPDRARIQVEQADLRRDAPAQLQALIALTASAPRDAAAWHSLGDNLMAAHDYGKSADAFRKAVNLDADDVTAWNQLGYASAYAGDLPAGMNALRRYQSLRPADSNPLDSMGDVNLIGGRLREAEEYYLEADKRNSGALNHADLFKAAMARLMTGDISGADSLAKRLADARDAAHDPQAPVFRAEWLWLSGRRKQACQQMEAAARSAVQPLSGRAYNELALWYLMRGDRTAATRAVEQAQPPGTAGITRFLLQPPASPAEWTRRAAIAVPNPAAATVRETLVSTAMLLESEFAPASPLLRQLYENPATTSDPAVPVALAWALLETGRTSEAASLLRWSPIPPGSGPGPLISIYFPRFYYLRAVSAGNTDRARADYRLFLQLSGPDPLLWGEEQKAQAALR